MKYLHISVTTRINQLRCLIQKFVLLFITISIHQQVFGQVSVFDKDYWNIQPGVYEKKSLDKNLIRSSDVSIQPQTQLKSSPMVGFLKIQNEPIALFTQINASGKLKPAGLLHSSSVVLIDSVFYKGIYRESSQQWPLFFNVWYALRINGQAYYTDYKPHFITYKKTLSQFKQTFLLLSQSTGYDEYYDNGYPDYFFIVVLDDSNTVIFESQLLNFVFGDEFWEDDYVREVRNDGSGFTFIIQGLEQHYKARWSGKTLIEEKEQ